MNKEIEGIVSDLKKIKESDPSRFSGFKFLREVLDYKKKHGIDLFSDAYDIVLKKRFSGLN